MVIIHSVDFFVYSNKAQGLLSISHLKIEPIYFQNMITLNLFIWNETEPFNVNLKDVIIKQRMEMRM